MEVINMKNYKYWDVFQVEKLRKDISATKEEMENYNLDVGVVHIYIDSSLGQYVPMELMIRLGKVKDEEEFVEKYYENGEERLDIVLEEVENLITEIDNELQDLNEEFNLAPEGYTLMFGWDDGDISLLLVKNLDNYLIM